VTSWVVDGILSLGGGSVRERRAMPSMRRLAQRQEGLITLTTVALWGYTFANSVKGSMLEEGGRGMEGKLLYQMVQEDLEERARVGLLKYGQYLSSFNGRSALQDLYEELLDAACYTKQKLLEEHEEYDLVDARAMVPPDGGIYRQVAGEVLPEVVE
jgi:hypothetical protein